MHTTTVLARLFRTSFALLLSAGLMVSSADWAEAAPLCGNDVVEDGEECDGVDDGACPGKCIPPGSGGDGFCGDEEQNEGEECTCAEECDGTDNDDCPERCRSNCTCGPPGCGQNPEPCCGDGNQDPGEECDHGVQSETCNHDCSEARCGDGIVNSTAGEQCDEPSHLGRCTDKCEFEPCLGVECSRLAVADTHIEVGEDGIMDHGLAFQIEVDAEKRAIAFLKFDLSDIRAQILQAELKLFCTNSSDDGGTIYPVRDSSWVEGDRDGADKVISRESPSWMGPGLKWPDVDADGDGSVGVTERSRYAPDFTRPIARLPACVPGETYSVSVTSAFQSGPGVYSLGMTNDDSNSAKFASRQHPNPMRRPVLHLKLAYVCGNGGDREPGEECDDGNRVDGDGCDSNCTSTGCGNGIVTTGEQCDDGNTEDGDCCSSECTREGLGPCCGNGVTEDGEECDDAGESIDCDIDCTDATCGDGVRNATAGEGCDDGNTEPGDGCEADCTTGCCNPHGFGGCDGSICEDCVCGIDEFCCSVQWDERCVVQAEKNCGGACLCGACRSEPGTTCRLNPVADTYIEGPNTQDDCPVNDCATCGHATWDHGGRARFAVDGDPRGIGYLKFDLRGLTVPVINATLRLFCVNGSDNGGDIYPLGESDWVEGDCSGRHGLCACDLGNQDSCACEPGPGNCFRVCDEECGKECEPGEDLALCSDVPDCSEVSVLKFMDLDTNGDGKLEDESEGPYLPDFTQPPLARMGKVAKGEHYLRDVTAAFQKGPGVYSLVISQTEVPDDAIYVTREHLDQSAQPLLELTLGCMSHADCPIEKPCTPRICNENGLCEERPKPAAECVPCSADAHCDDGNPCTLDVCVSLEDGCLRESNLAPVMLNCGMEAAACALEPYQPDPCTEDKAFTKAGDFVSKLNDRMSKIETKLENACKKPQPKPTRVMKKCLKKLRKLRKKVARRVPLPGVRAGVVSTDCGRLLFERLNLAGWQLKDLLRTKPATLCDNKLCQ